MTIHENHYVVTRPGNEVLVTGLVADQGTLVVLAGLTEDNREVRFACERRYAYDILAAVEAGDEPVALVPSYMILRGA